MGKPRTSLCKRSVPHRRRQNPGHILHDKKARSQLTDNLDKVPKEVPPVVIQRSTPAGGAEALTTGTSGDESWTPPFQSCDTPDVSGLDLLNPLFDHWKVRPVRRDRRGGTPISLNRDVQIEAAALKPEI